ncbi:hypothetical protein ALMA_0963 [Alloscardovia macacae]|uniref:Uncharacterized protein n=1 Tax=Alloscardovia macacae TaxID=1160091 RepID=A0A261F5U2_9BIFI|nr:hypothetical protein ALMA_0963 [Alloscardovia macacae]
MVILAQNLQMYAYDLTSHGKYSPLGGYKIQLSHHAREHATAQATSQENR